LITAGKYSVWFRTPIGEGAGVVELKPSGELSGYDTAYAYSGNWERAGELFTASLSVKRVVPGPPGVFGVDEIDIKVAGRSGNATTASCTGFAEQSPGLELAVTLVRMASD
jgi:hypothetical protein